uniref:Uncharacterized protein n=1 Tax=Arundo donax TaxID=35708 RepID=A0A0A9GDR1_ARUDO
MVIQKIHSLSLVRIFHVTCDCHCLLHLFYWPFPLSLM